LTGKRGARRWLRGHLQDPYVREANARGYRSRAAFKLMQIDDASRVLQARARVLDLGAAPGGWTQVAVERTRPGGLVLAVDRLEMEPVPGAEVLTGDFQDAALRRGLRDRLGSEGADLVMSDMAPNISGVREADQARGAELTDAVLAFALEVLAPRGAVLLKLFQGVGTNAALEAFRQRFREVKVVKPKASRARSAETYLLARGPMVYSDPGPGG
jgi:23S rRNA (uridine2552-2'-O)-methyltransferase